VTASTNSNVLCVASGLLIAARLDIKEFQDMLAIIATLLIVLWLLGFLAFHVSTGLIHVLLVVGIVMLIAHFFRGRSAIA
jgi:hypothetical protein